MKTPPSNTPWGMIQFKTEIIPGLWAVSTSSHGGLWLSGDRVDQMHSFLKDTIFDQSAQTGRQWYEEDCDWSIPFYAMRDDIEEKYGMDSHEGHAAYVDAPVALARWYPRLACQLKLISDSEYAKRCLEEAKRKEESRIHRESGPYRDAK